MFSRPVVVVTGANSGVGFGICHRLLAQLSRKDPSNELALECDGLTIVLACRSRQRAEAAKNLLYDLADKQVRRCKESPTYDGHAEIFRKNLHIATHPVDLTDLQTVFRFADEVARTYPYVSHLVCNAGLIPYERIDWGILIRQMLTDIVGLVSNPAFNVLRVGDLSSDGLGYTWQCNLFGHYALFRALEPLMTKCPIPTGPRVIWISSPEASSKFYDPKDWQLLKSAHSYTISKYQMNMLSMQLDRHATRDAAKGKPAVRHLIAFPSIVATNIAGTVLGVFSTWGMVLMFYVARFLGSSIHPISPFKAAISAVYLSLVSLAFIPDVAETSTNLDEPMEVGTVFVAHTNRWGRERVDTLKLSQTRMEEMQTEELLANCDRLLQTLCDAHGRKSPSG